MTFLLRRRLGELPEPIQAGLRATSVERLETWSVLLLGATGLKELGACVEMMRSAN